MQIPYKAVIFDMDGVLFDTEAIGYATCRQILAGMGRADMPLELYIEFMAGGTDHYHTRMRQVYGEDLDLAFFDAEYARLVEAATRRDGVPKKPGLDALLAWLKDAGLPMAVASSTRQARVQQNLASTGIAGYFEAVIGGDMVARGKPHPDIFLKAAGELGLRPEYCLAVEDSYNGIESATAAGCTTVMVPDLAPPIPAVRAKVAAVLDSLADLPAFLQGAGQ